MFPDAAIAENADTYVKDKKNQNENPKPTPKKPPKQTNQPKE